MKRLGDFSKYNLFLVDVWGVLHNGEKLYPEVNETLDRLKNFGEVVLFSNAPFLEAQLHKDLKKLGIIEVPPVITSGVVTKFFLEHLNDHNNLITQNDILNCANTIDQAKILEGTNKKSEHAQELISQLQERTFEKMNQKKAFAIGNERTNQLLVPEAVFTQNVEESDFILLSDFPDYLSKDDFGLEIIMQEIYPGIAKKVPVYCAGPDIISVSASGTVYAAGKIAEEYTSLGGNVLWFGKPWPMIYEYAFAKFPNRKILVIGDGLGTDIKGANLNNLESCWIINGVNQDYIDFANFEESSKKAFETFNGIPNFYIPYFKDLF